MLTIRDGPFPFIRSGPIFLRQKAARHCHTGSFDLLELNYPHPMVDILQVQLQTGKCPFLCSSFPISEKFVLGQSSKIFFCSILVLFEVNSLISLMVLSFTGLV